MKIALTSVFVNDPNEAFTFYTEVLGFIPRLHMPEAQIAIVASPEEPDGTGLLLEPAGGPIAGPYQEALYKAGIPAIVFGAEDVQKEYEALEARGVVFRKPPTRTDYGTEALFEDTCGNLIQLHHP